MAPVTRSNTGASSDSEEEHTVVLTQGNATVAGSSNAATASATALAPRTLFEDFLARLRLEADLLGYAVGTAGYTWYLESQLTKEKEREHELKMANIRNSRPATPASAEGPVASARRLLPPQPAFNPSSEPLDRYLRSYEDYCALTSVSAEDQAIGLTSLLPSNLRAALDNLSCEERRDYPTVRETLLRVGAYTQEAYRRHFLEADPMGQESTHSFLMRKRQYLNDWLQAAGVGDDLLRDFFVVDDLIHSMPPSFGAYVREGDTYNIRTLTGSLTCTIPVDALLTFSKGIWQEMETNALDATTQLR